MTVHSRQSFCITNPKQGNMKKNASLWICLTAMVMAFSSCQVIGDIFKAGFWTAIILIVLVVGLILWLVGRSRK